MSVVLVTGSGGLVGAEAVRFFSALGFDTVGIDNDMRRYFFGDDASTADVQRQLEATVPGYRHADCDIRDETAVTRLFRHYGRDIHAVIHAAAQPSHDWAAREPTTDFTVNANGTLTLLEATRNHAPDAVFVFTSTNKVYGDAPNALPLIERETRWELDPAHPFAAHGIDETMSVDGCLHSLFGAGKLAADVLVQEYGRYFGLKTGCFRGGCLTGPGHAGTQLHGFLSYLVKCAVLRERYTVMGYNGKQVRDNIHSYDLVNAFWQFIQAPQAGAVYNIGGGRHSNCSMLEAIALCEKTTGYEMNRGYQPENRVGDHIWWISDVRRFQAAYPAWSYRYTLPQIIGEIADAVNLRSPKRQIAERKGARLMPSREPAADDWRSQGVSDLLSVVIPARNEEGHIGATVRELTATLRGAGIAYDVLVVNDNSSDATESVLQQLGNEDSGVRYVNNRPPNGFGFAVRRGSASFAATRSPS